MTTPGSSTIISVDDVVPIPETFLSAIAPAITEIAELQVSLALFRLANASGGFHAAVPEPAIERDRALRRALRVEGSPREPKARIALGLDLAVGRGTLCKFGTEHEGERRVWYYLNTLANRALVEGMSRGAIPPPRQIWHEAAMPTVEPERPNVFRVYEQNIGLLTPLLAERIVEALERYPTDWIEAAIGEAVVYNRRSWRYVSRILENWTTGGRGEAGPQAGSHETNRRSDEKTLDPDQYKHGRHLDRSGRGGV